MRSSIKSKVTSFKWKTRRKDSDASKDCSFKNYSTIEGCTYHFERNEDRHHDNVTYVTLEIYIDGANGPIILNPLTITALKSW